MPDDLHHPEEEDPMSKVTIDNVTDVVIASLGQNGEINERQREIMISLLKHLHGFCKDVKLQHSEFIDACMFLARAGAICDDKRQEFILLGDILGVEVLCDMLTNPITGNESESTVLGPFYRENPPVLPHGASTAQKHFEGEETVFMEGYIKDTAGKPLAGVTLDIWEDAPNGLYENHDHDQPDFNLRGRFETDENGYLPCARCARCPIRSRRIKRRANCCATWAATPTAPATCISSWPKTATARSSARFMTGRPSGWTMTRSLR